jgi:hypothetical protein
MRRRAFLGSVGIAALAGCNGEDADPTTQTPSTTGTGTAAFDLLTVDSPERTQLNDPTEFSFVVENTGSSEGTFTSALETRQVGGEWTRATEIEMPLSAGERGEWRSPRFGPQYLTTYEFRLAAFDRTWSIDVVPKQIMFGQPYAVPSDLFINVEGGSFESTYPTPNEDDGATTTETQTTEPTATTEATETADATPTGTPDATPTPTDAPEGSVWAVLRVVVRNRLQEESQPAPPASSFSLSVDGETPSLRQDVAPNPYEGGPLAPRTVRMGELVSSVPADTGVNELEVTWERSLAGGDVSVTWA